MKMKGKGKVHAKLASKAFRQAANPRFLRIGIMVEGEAKRSMRKGGGTSREPSTPPDPPNRQTGNLATSIATGVDRNGVVVVGSSGTAWYGLIHEHGGEFGGRFYPARPFMVPAMLRVRKKMAEKLKGLRVAQTPAGIQVSGKSGRSAGL